MSKNFEEEYKALADQELPDLWDRIEKDLSPRSTPREPVKRSAKMIQLARRYKGSLVAVVCVLFILPAAILISRSTRKSDTAVQIADERFRRPVVLTEGLESMPEEAAAEAGEDAAHPEESETGEDAAHPEESEAREGAAHPEEIEEASDLKGAVLDATGTNGENMAEASYEDATEAGIALLSENPGKKQSSAEKSQAHAEADEFSSSQIFYEKVAFRVQKVSEKEPQKIEIIVLQEQEAFSAGTKLWVQKAEDIKLTSGESYYGDLVFQEKEHSYMLKSIYPERP